MDDENMRLEAPHKRAADSRQQPVGTIKRRRSVGEDCSFDGLLEQAGCEVVSSRDGNEYIVDDPRQLRRCLEQRLMLNDNLRRIFQDGLQEHLGPAEVLRSALQPMSAASPGVQITGDSFVRTMLNVAPLQKELSEFLLQRIPEFAHDDEAVGATTTAPQLILGQFRWLDALADPHALTVKLLEVLPAMPSDAQRHAITFLPEVATDEDHVEVLNALEALVQEDAAFVLPAIDALSNMALDGEGHERVVGLVQERFQSAEVEDLPAVVRFLLQAAGGSGACGVAAAVREGLHFVTPSDPRLPVPDRKQKGRVAAAGDEPECKVLEAVRQALQLNPAAADAVMREVRGATDPRTFDLWALLALCTLGGDRRKAALALLRKKFVDGGVGAAWLERSVAGHAAALGPHFQALLAAAHYLLCALHAGAAAAGAALYASIFHHFPDSYSRQEVLRMLHSHLGASAQAEATAALGVLRQLARDDTSDLLQYASFLTNVLDYVCGYSDDQLAAVFEVFAELVVRTCSHQHVRGGGSRMEDELFIFLRKQLSGAQAVHRKVGVVGSVALVQRLGAAVGLEADHCTPQQQHGQQGMVSPLAERYREARALLDRTLADGQRCPESFAFLCDELARGVRRGTLSKALMADLDSQLTAILEDSFVADRESWVAQGAGRAAWWDLDNGASSDLVITLMPAAAEAGGMPAEVGAGAGDVAPLFPLLRVVSALQLSLRGHLEGIDALLGCPMGLFTAASLADPERFQQLGAPAQRSLLLGLFYAANWCREAVNAFAPLMDPARKTPNPGDGNLPLKIFSRLSAACQLEAALGALLPLAPPLFALPCLGAGALASGPAAGMAKAAKGSGKGRKKKAAKFEQDEEGQEEGSGGGSAGTTRQASEQATRSTGSGSTQGAAAGAGAAPSAAALAAARPMFRDLLPSALPALTVAVDSPDRCYFMLPPAAYLLTDLVGKLRVSLAPAKRPTFLRPAAAKVAAVPAAVLLPALCPMLPALRRHLDTATHALTEELSDGAMAAEDHVAIWSGALAAGTQAAAGSTATAATYLCSIDGCAAAQAAASPSAAAGRVTSLSLECLRLVMAYPDIVEPDHRPVLQSLLGAFSMGGQNPEDLPEQWTRQQLMAGCRRVCFYLMDAVPDEEDELTCADMDRWHGALLATEVLISLAERLTKGLPPAGSAASAKADAKIKAKLLRKMSATLGASARRMLKQRWPAPTAAGAVEAAAVAAGGWRGRAAPLAEALRLSILYSSDPAATVSEYVKDGLLHVTTETRGKANAEPLAAWPSLSGATLAVWYRVCWEALLARWDLVVASAVGAAKEEDAGGGEAAGAISAGVSACAAAFRDLLSVVQPQEQRTALHGPALKKGGKEFMDGMAKVLPFWEAVFTEQRDGVMAAIKCVQKGTRTLHRLCAEGKTRRDMALAAHVPQVKRSIERFVMAVVPFLRQHSQPVSWGELKHRDLGGREVPSQLYPQQEDSDDEGESLAAEDGEDDEVMGESQGHLESDDADE